MHLSILPKEYRIQERSPLTASWHQLGAFTGKLLSTELNMQILIISNISKAFYIQIHNENSPLNSLNKFLKMRLIGDFPQIYFPITEPNLPLFQIFIKKHFLDPAGFSKLAGLYPFGALYPWTNRALLNFI